MALIRILLCLAAVSLAGCATTPQGPTASEVFNAAESTCGDGPLTAFGECLQSQLDFLMPGWRSDPHGDLVAIYIAWAEAAGEKVSSNDMTTNELGLGLALLRSRLTEIAQERNARLARTAALNQSNQQAQLDSALSRMLTGLALLEAAQPRPLPLGARGMVTCSQTGRFINCF